MSATVDAKLSSLLNFFRWFSALLVVISHSRSIIFVPWGNVESPGVLIKVFYFASAWGDYGVLMFFAISGFLIGGGVLERMRQGGFGYGRYFIDRLSRIYIVLVPALLIVWALDTTGLAILNGSGIYTREFLIGALPVDTREATGWAPFVANLFMLQGVATPPFGTAQPLWSLNWEWWSYLVAPFTVGLLLRLGDRCAVVAAAVFAAALAATGLGYMLLWHLGILLALIRFRSRSAFAFSLVVCIALPVVTRASLIPAELPAQAIFILAFTVLLSQLRHLDGGLAALPALHERLARFSFSLYVLHNSILIFAMAVLQTYFALPRQLQPTPGAFAFYFAMLALTYAAANLFATFTENHTGRLRRALIRLVYRGNDK